MKIRKVLLGVLCLMLMICLTGCDSAEIASLENLQAMNSEAEVKEVSLSTNEKEAAVFARVTELSLLDVNTLQQVDSGVESAVISYMDGVNATLTGGADSSKSVIDTKLTDYMLACFELTPFTWTRSSMTIRGVDTTSGNIVVDVSYKTTSTAKPVTKESGIPLGCDNYDQRLSVRLYRWTNVLEAKYKGGSSNLETSWQTALAQFKKAYGDPNDIISTQREGTLTEEMAKTQKQRCYKGLVDSDYNKIGATMSFRFVLVPNYVLGINQGYDCAHLYMLDYKILNDPTVDKKAFSQDGIDTLTETVYQHLYSYFKCCDECNYTGIYKLVDKMSGLDNYYKDRFETAYIKNDNFTLTIFDVQGTTVQCGVTLSRKERPKGSKISYPIYSDRIAFTLALVDGELKITDETLLSRTIEGEPAIKTKDLGNTVEGFASEVNLKDSDKQSIEQLIASLGVCQLSQNFTSAQFSDVVDISASTNDVESVKTSLSKMTGEKKVVWVISYLQGTDKYASVKCRELFQHSDGEIYETSAILSFINKSEGWRVSDYRVMSSTKIDAKELATKNALCVVSKTGIDSMTSQVDNSGEPDVETKSENLGKTITY